ncbi:hypothetical protein ACFWGP_05525 [Agromyces sp. NPDC127015]|uniref:hypothetical protein n=1 Tax=Agromyces sp. NPDC127015 TaxID=3347108 RepID=UPI00366436FC
MRIGYHYGAAGTAASMIDGVELYAEPGYEPPESFTLTRDGREVEFVRLSDRTLECNKAEGGCGSYDCHRLTLGKCRCSGHKNPRPQRAAPAKVAVPGEENVWHG